MASSRKSPSASRGAGPKSKRAPIDAARALLERVDLRGRRLVVGLSGGVDSVVLLHVLRELAPERGYRLSALHVDHGLSAHASQWRRFCAALCRRWGVAFTARRVAITAKGRGLEAAAREARRAVFAASAADALALGHQLDDQAETVLLNLLRGAGVRGASAMQAIGALETPSGSKPLLRPLLTVPRESILAYARARGLHWVNDESNASPAFTRNFLRLEITPRIADRFPRWRECLARAAGHFADAEQMLRHAARGGRGLPVARLRAAGPAQARLLLREFLTMQGLRPPSAAQLAEMLRQVLGASAGAQVAIAHQGAVLRRFRGEVLLTGNAPKRLAPIAWHGERCLPISALGGELRFRSERGAGIDRHKLDGARVTIRTRAGGERLQPDTRRPRRSLKNLFQEAGVPPWQRDALPLLFCGETLVWAPGLGVDAAFRAGKHARGLVPEWQACGLRAAAPRS